MLEGAFRAAKVFAARARTVKPRFSGQYMAGIFRLRDLPETVQEMLATRTPALQQYELLSQVWHRIGSMTVPDYGPYVRYLVRNQEIGRHSALDLACGTGISTAALAQEFDRVYALDASPHMLAAARQELRTYSNVDYVVADFGAFELTPSVDVAVCSGDALNYAASVADLTAAFRCVGRALNPRGLFLFDLESESGFLQSNGLAYRYRVDGLELYQVFKYDAETQVAEACVISSRGVEEHRRRCFRRDEVLDAAEAAGLRPRDDFKSRFLRVIAQSTRDFHVLQRDA